LTDKLLFIFTFIEKEFVINDTRQFFQDFLIIMGCLLIIIPGLRNADDTELPVLFPEGKFISKPGSAGMDAF